VKLRLDDAGGDEQSLRDLAVGEPWAAIVAVCSSAGVSAPGRLYVPWTLH